MTIKDIARESGYSLGTVSRCLNHQPGVSAKAQARINEIVQKYGFKLNTNAKHLKQTGKDAIAIIIKGTQNMLFASIVELLQQKIAKEGYAGNVYYIDEEANEVETAMSICRERNPYGIMFLGSNLDFFNDDFRNIDVPCILVTNSGEGLGFSNLSSVSTDDTAAARYAIEHLIELGHQSIGVLGGIKSKSVAAGNRYAGCLEGFDANGIFFDPKSDYTETHFTVPCGYRAMEKLLGMKKDITAVFAMSDTLAIGAIRAICDHGFDVPEDISVIGFDGIDMGNYYTPRLTTIQQHQETIASRTVEILLERISDPTLPPVHEVEPFRLIPGESVRRMI